MTTAGTTAGKDPASYFPSVERQYGRPIAQWQELIRSSGALVAHTLAERTGD